MPTSLTVPQTPRYVPALPTKENLQYADLAIIDLSKAATAEGRAELAVELREALTTHGFCYIINHGYTQAQNERMFDIVDIPMSGVPEDEKRAYTGDSKKTGILQGYKPRQYWHIDAGVRDQLEHYASLRPFLPDLDAFARLQPWLQNLDLTALLRLMALSLELPEDTFVKLHDFDAPGISYLSFMKYFPRSEEEEVRTKNVWMKGHTDFGSITLLWSQPVAALQIQTKEGWRWVKHIENALLMNIGDSMEFLTGGFYKGTIHRVVQPPIDQRGYTRLSLIYFSFLNDDVNPVLQRVGVERRCEDDVAPTMKAWRVARISAYGTSDLQKGKEPGIEEEVLNGIVVNYYN
ncbi:Clavaminate synthase-like protein [Suillus subalutaceus]|uniref:Clavaminate synthase-like protein n=1 Tax=Suillus subalutaceus TaxID=48586 RepID=UPI001B86516D|nr:Clavaminate synthase-like protein [Suillus subalutaceus]KAG1872947.1 Clavaminate synthase-like protein [Suillus subalutaceus]